MKAEQTGLQLNFGRTTTPIQATQLATIDGPGNSARDYVNAIIDTRSTSAPIVHTCFSLNPRGDTSALATAGMETFKLLRANNRSNVTYTASDVSWYLGAMYAVAAMFCEYVNIVKLMTYANLKTPRMIDWVTKVPDTLQSSGYSIQGSPWMPDTVSTATVDPVPYFSMADIPWTQSFAEAQSALSVLAGVMKTMPMTTSMWEHVLWVYRTTFNASSLDITQLYVNHVGTYAKGTTVYLPQYTIGTQTWSIADAGFNAPWTKTTAISDIYDLANYVKTLSSYSSGISNMISDLRGLPGMALYTDAEALSGVFTPATPIADETMFAAIENAYGVYPKMMPLGANTSEAQQIAWATTSPETTHFDGIDIPVDANVKTPLTGAQVASLLQFAVALDPDTTTGRPATPYWKVYQYLPTKYYTTVLGATSIDAYAMISPSVASTNVGAITAIGKTPVPYRDVADSLVHPIPMARTLAAGTGVAPNLVQYNTTYINKETRFRTYVAPDRKSVV